MIDIKVMIDCGAEGNFIDQTYTAIMGIKKTALARPIKVQNIDGTLNQAGTITHYVNITLEIGERKRNEWLYITKLGKQKVILGTPWLKKENPDINWQLSMINWRNEVHPRPPSKEREEGEFTDPPEHLEELAIQHGNFEELWINTKLSHSQTIAHGLEQKKDIPIQELVLELYHKWLDIFNEKASHRFPDPRPWDHAIDMKPDFEPKSFKAYSLTPEERDLQETFIKENLEKGYIRPSKSPMASPFFFVAKKEKGKLRPTQDYRYLNEWTIKSGTYHFYDKT